MTPTRHGSAAFTLVELSIVLVILGLLVGGVLTGQSLIRAAELRSVSADYSRYLAATHSFRDKYFALPGDMANATSFWTTGTANGNGNGQIQTGSGASVTGEIYQFWTQLTLAGLIEGTYTGLAGSGGALHMVIGTNIPKAKLSNAGWGLREFNATIAGDGSVPDGAYGHWLQLGNQSAPNDNASAVLKPEEAWNIDTKIDDGQPMIGAVVARSAFTGNICSTAANSAALSATYLLSGTSVGCALVFRKFGG